MKEFQIKERKLTLWSKTNFALYPFRSPQKKANLISLINNILQFNNMTGNQVSWQTIGKLLFKNM